MPQSHTRSKCHPSLVCTSRPNKVCSPIEESTASPSSTAPRTTSSNPTRHTGPATVCCVPPGRRRGLVMVMPGRSRARMGAAYQCLPRPQTKPKTMWSCMWKALPNLTGSCARGAKLIGGFGLVVKPLPMLTTAPIWLHLHSLALLPNPTTWPVKYTHEQRTQHRPTHGSRGHCPVPRDDTVASDSEHGVRPVHPIQPGHISQVHLPGTRAHTPQPTRGHTTPPRDIERGRSESRRSSPHDHVRATIRLRIVLRSCKIW